MLSLCMPGCYEFHTHLQCNVPNSQILLKHVFVLILFPLKKSWGRSLALWEWKVLCFIASYGYKTHKIAVWHSWQLWLSPRNKKEIFIRLFWVVGRRWIHTWMADYHYRMVKSYSFCDWKTLLRVKIWHLSQFL